MTRAASAKLTINGFKQFCMYGDVYICYKSRQAVPWSCHLQTCTLNYVKPCIQICRPRLSYLRERSTFIVRTIYVYVIPRPMCSYATTHGNISCIGVNTEQNSGNFYNKIIWLAANAKIYCKFFPWKTTYRTQLQYFRFLDIGKRQFYQEKIFITVP